MSLRIVPSAKHPKETSNTSTKTSDPQLSNGAPSAPGIPDTLRASLTGTADSSSTGHPLEARLKQWRQTQEALKMENLRRIYGIAEPVRRGMEQKIVREGEWRPLALGGGRDGGVHADILSGRESEVAWEDVFKGEELREPPSFHDEMEQRLKMN